MKERRICMERENVEVGELNEFISSIAVGTPDTFRNLGVFPLFSKKAYKNGYALVEDVIPTGKFVIEEVSEGGSVPELMATNLLSDIDVLIFQGEQLIGAKQNRIVNTSIIVPRSTSLKIPVSCCEKNRWSYKSRRFSASSSPLYASLRKKSSESILRSLRRERSYRSDQHEVWDSIREKSDRMNTYSETAAMEDIYARYENTVKAYESGFGTYLGQIGFVSAINGEIAGCDIVGAGDVFGRVYKKMLRGYILDAVDAGMTNDNKEESERHTMRNTASAERFLRKTLSARRESYKSLGEGNEIRFEDKDMSGFALVRDKNIVHMAVFA
jgi:hypothetical protein